jgi:predicted aldo/keto reductase-like oxidoreductase
VVQKKNSKINRRNFLKTVGAAGLAPVLTSCKETSDSEEPDAPAKQQESTFPQVPRRKLGKTGVEVPRLAIGLMYSLLENQILLHKALDWGINYWDTSTAYAGGNSERGIGKFFEKNPDARKKVFLVSKASGAMTIADVEKRLHTSFERMNTDYIDMYFGVHALSSPSQLTNELRDWVTNAKKKKQIGFFGFSTHENMAENLLAAAKLGWVDAIMTSYNFRVMVQDAKMPAAIEACHKAGVGLIAMKTQGKPSWEIKTEADKWVLTEAEKKLTAQLLKLGFSTTQANIKIVLDDERFSSVCAGMTSVAQIVENAAVTFDKTKLTDADLAAFRQYAKASCSGYCAGCAKICSQALPEIPCINDIMRCLMYYNSYGDKAGARGLFAKIPATVRNKLPGADYTKAEAHCPQHMPIGKLMAEAVRKLA